MKPTKRGYYKNNHSCFLLQFHLVLVTKYRKPVINRRIEIFLKHYIKTYFEERNLVLQAFECMPDHIHILFDAYPQINLAETVNAFKSASSRQIRKTFPDNVGKYYQKPYFWSRTYYLGTVSEKNTETVRKYIENQKG